MAKTKVSRGKKQMVLRLAKDNLKFSAAHFLIFDSKRAEKLHGHNYQVQVSFYFDAEKTENKGFKVDFSILKSEVKKRLDLWDEVVLLPHNNIEMKFKSSKSSLEVRFRDRFYVFPKNEVVLLPVSNTSVEALSEILANDFIKMFSQLGVQGIEVLVEETRGQGAVYRIEPV